MRLRLLKQQVRALNCLRLLKQVRALKQQVRALKGA